MKRHFWVLAVLIAGLSPALAGEKEQLEYGEYLSGECTTCHRLDGSDKGIPSIVGWDKDAFVEVLKAYKKGDLDNQAMVSVAKVLDDEQMTALAAYFATKKPKDE